MTATQAYSDPARARRVDPVAGEGRVCVRVSEDVRTAPSSCAFRTFGTVVELGAYGPADSCCAVFGEAVGRCRDYERCLRRDGVLYHHVLDPRTGMPVETDLASATVIAARALDAEGFSTTLLALGTARAAELAREEAAIARAVLIDTAGRVVAVG